MASSRATDAPAASLGVSPASRGNETEGFTGGAVQKGVSQSIYTTPSVVDKAIIIKWSIVGGLFLLLALWIVIGHLHAKARQRKGLPLLFYHKYLVSTPRTVPTKATSASYRDSLDTAEYLAPPPPAYNPSEPSPPGYRTTGEIPETISRQVTDTSPSELEQQAMKPKRSFLTKILRLGRESS